MTRASLLIALALALASAAAQPAWSAPAGPGCHPAEPAVAHYSGGARVARQPAGAPVPCGMETGYAGGESAIAVTNAGAVIYAPAVESLAGVQTQYFLGGNSGFARTTDLGRTWSFVDPTPTPLMASSGAGPGDYPAWDQIDDKFFMDRATGRLFWTDPDIPTETVLHSDDDGVSWTTSLLPVGFGGEWTQVTTAPPRTSRTTGYPKVVYACGEYDSVGRDVTTALEGDLCQKSLDGGQTWIFAGQGLFGGPVATHPECDGQTEHPNFSPWAAPDSSGRLYELLFCANQTFVLRSTDEAATWSVAARVPYEVPAVGPGGTGSAELRTDSQNNMYLAWTTPGNPNPNGAYAPGKLYLAVSRDYGQSWSAPLSVLAPGVQGVVTHFGFDVGAPGHVAFSYLGQASGRPGFDGYITETADALSSKPLFWSGVVNDRAEPPLDFGGKGGSNGLGLDYVSVAIGPDGTPWASFWDACGEDLPQAAACPADRKTPATTTYGYTDFAGRLAPAGVTPHGPSRAQRLASLPSTRSCGPSASLRIRIARGAGVAQVLVLLDGRQVRRIRGRRLRAPVDLRHLPRARFTVTLVVRLNGGRSVRITRRYRACRQADAPRFTG